MIKFDRLNQSFLPSGVKSVFLFEKDVDEVINGAEMGGSVSVSISLGALKISGSASFKSIDNSTTKDNSLKVTFHGDFLIGRSGHEC